MTDRRPRWSAIAFAVLFAVIAFALVAGPIFDALPPADPARVRSDVEMRSSSDRMPLPRELQGRWHGQSAPLSIAVGDEAEVELEFQNLGQVPWIKGSPTELRLAEVGADVLPAEMRASWPYPDRPAVQSEVAVYPPQVATFNFKVKGSAPGTYRLRVRPVVEGVAWLAEEGIDVEVTVR
jgi:hypothetical protein